MRRRTTTLWNIYRAAQELRRLVAGLLAFALLATVVFAAVHPGVGWATTSTPAGDGSVEATGIPVTTLTAGDGIQPVASGAATASTESSMVARGSEPTHSAGVTVTVSPDETRSIDPGHAISYTFLVTNETSSSGMFDLTATSTAGFDTQLDSQEETSIASVMLGAGETTQVIATISVPETASVGAVDVTTLAATLESTPSVWATADAVTRVLDDLMLTPDNTGYAGPGDTVIYRHTLTNSWPTTRTVALSYGDALGWPATLLAADGVTEITSVTVGPYGGSAEVVARLSVPTTASTPATDTLTLEASADGNSAQADDTTIVWRLGTYADASCTVPAQVFQLTDTVYARSTALEPSATVCFVWKDATGAVARESATATVDASGTVSDQYGTVETDTVGDWSVELHSDSSTGTIIDQRSFALTFKADITALSASDGRNADATIAISASVVNLISREITASTLTYLIWWDGNGDGSYGAGDTYIDASGTPLPYSVDATTHVTPIASVAPTGTWSEAAPWTMSNHDFPEQGTYNVTAVWRDAHGTVIDQKTAQFWAIPALGWPLFALCVGGLGYAMWRRRDARSGGTVASGPSGAPPRRLGWPSLRRPDPATRFR